MEDLDAESYKILFGLRNAESSLLRFRKKIEKKHVTVFFGNTKSGKSTVINFVQGNELVAFEKDSGFKICAKHPNNRGPSIGQNSLSHTTVPSVWPMNEQSSTLLIDTPGFSDNRGIVQEILNALYINQIKYAKTVRFVLVADVNDIIIDNIQGFIDLIKNMHTLFPNFELLKEALSIIFTKDCEGYSREDFMSLLKQKILDVDGDLVRPELVEYFVENRHLIGNFRMPTASGDLSETIGASVNEAITGSRKVDIQESNVHFCLSDRAQAVLLETYEKMISNINFNKELAKTVAEFDNYLTIDKYVFASTDSELTSTRTHLQEILDKIREEKRHYFRTVVQVKHSLNKLVTHQVNRLLMRQLDFLILAETLTLLDDKVKVFLIQNYVRPLEEIVCNVERLILKIERETADRKEENMKYIISMAWNDKTKVIASASAGIAALKAALEIYGVDVPATITVTKIGGAAFGLAGASMAGAAIGSYGTIYLQRIRKRQILREQQGRFAM